MIKNMSKADVEFIKRSLRFTKKNKELNHKDSNRMNYLLNNLDKDEAPQVFADVIKIYQKSYESQ
jgi:hypothetical protein|tara:strand:- start:35 stop:229 length:195 start_codon:yes stop_codon:yes gene_type:complete